MAQINPKVTWIAIIAIAISSSDCRSLKVNDYGYMNTMKEMEKVAPSSKFCKFYKDLSALTWILCHVFDHDSGTINFYSICEFNKRQNMMIICFNQSINSIFDI